VKRKLIETLRRRQHGANRVEKRVRGNRAKSRLRLLRSTLEGKSPREHPAVGVLNTRFSPGTLERVKAQKPRLVEPAPALRCEGIPTGERYVGSSEPETAGYLSRGEGSEGRIPGALPVRNKTGTVSKGVNRQEGNQTLKAEHGGQANARGKRTFETSSAVGNESP
jgi:hypothetical protein